MKTSTLFIIGFLLLATICIVAILFLNQDLFSSSTAGLTEPILEPLPKPTASRAKILFVGDIMLDRGVLYYSQKAAGQNRNDFVFKKIKNELLKNDIVIGNLEGPITANPSVSVNSKMESPESYFFTFDPSWAKTLYENRIQLVNLGNNHILNFNSSGLQETKKYLTKAGVEYFGAPDFPKTALTEINKIKIAVISYNEFSAYGKIEPEAVLKEIKKAKGISDIVVIYTHWGAEYVPDPALEIKKLARSFIDAGADLVIGSHPHVIQPIEVYKGKRIYYSLGNFIFDQYFSEETKTGMGVVVEIDKNNRTLEFEEIYFYTQENGQTVIVEK